MSTLSDSEKAVYDRQIRMWGMEAQIRMRSFRVLLYGLGGVGAETAKNLILAGIGNITLMDHRVVTKEDISSSFLLSANDMNANRAVASCSRLQRLNPNVTVNCVQETIEDQSTEFFSNYDAVVVLSTELGDLCGKIDTICRSISVPFFSVASSGMSVMLFIDAQHYEYVSVELGGTKTFESQLFPDWFTAMAADPRNFFKRKSRQRFAQQLSAFKYMGKCQSLHHSEQNTLVTAMLSRFEEVYGIELSPLCSIAGGLLAQEVLKLVTRDTKMLSNVVLIDGNSKNALVASLGCTK